MPVSLLPASAAAFAPRSAPTVVLNTRPEPWLTQALKRINRIKRPLNSAAQHQRCLTETLSGPNAIWHLCSIALPKAPASELRDDENLLVQALFNYQILHVEAYVVHVDMVAHHEVAFKLTTETIESLVEYHDEIHCVDVAASTGTWPDKELHVKKMKEDFVQSINKFVYRTGMRALEGLEDDGAGELLEGRSEQVRDIVTRLFGTLTPPPPPPQLYDQVRMGPYLHPSDLIWWQPAPVMAVRTHMTPVEPWRILPSTPSPTNSCAESLASWTSVPINETHLPSPAPSFSQPLFTSAPFYSSPPTCAPVPALPLPSLLAHSSCGPSAALAGYGYGMGLHDFAPQYTTQV